MLQSWLFSATTKHPGSLLICQLTNQKYSPYIPPPWVHSTTKGGEGVQKRPSFSSSHISDQLSFAPQALYTLVCHSPLRAFHSSQINAIVIHRVFLNIKGVHLVDVTWQWPQQQPMQRKPHLKFISSIT